MYFKEALKLIAFITFNILLAMGGFYLYNSIQASLLPIVVLLPLAFAVFLLVISIRVIFMQFDEWKWR